MNQLSLLLTRKWEPLKNIASNNYLQIRESLWKFRFLVEKSQNTTEAKIISLDALEKVKGTA